MLHRYRQLYSLQKKHKAFTQTKDLETRFNIQIINNQFIKQKDHYQKEKIKKVITLMKDELSKKIMTEFTALRPKTYSFLTNENDGKKTKGTKKCVIKRKIKI